MMYRWRDSESYKSVFFEIHKENWLSATYFLSYLVRTNQLELLLLLPILPIFHFLSQRIYVSPFRQPSITNEQFWYESTDPGLYVFDF